MKDELKAAIEAAKSRVELHSKGFGHREETAFLATHGDALIAAVELAEATQHLLDNVSFNVPRLQAFMLVNANEALEAYRTAKEGATP